MCDDGFDLFNGLFGRWLYNITSYINMRRLSSRFASVGSKKSATPTGDLLQKAIDSHKLMQFTEAEDLYKAVIKSDPRNAHALQLLGALKIQTDKPEEAIGFLRKSLLINPGASFVQSNLASAYEKCNKFDDAKQHAELALKHDPRNANGYVVLGNISIEMDLLDESMGHYERALLIDGSNVAAILGCGNVLWRNNRLRDALSCYERVLKISPSHVTCAINAANVLQDMGDFDQALRLYNRVLEISPNDARARFSRGVCLLRLGEWKEGFSEFEWRWKDQLVKEHRGFHQPLLDISQSISGKTVLLHAEQGLGDTIQFCRYAKEISNMGAVVICEVQPSLIDLLKGQVGIDVVLKRGDDLPSFDFHCPIMSLPYVFSTSVTSVPADQAYLKVNAVEAAKWKSKICSINSLRVGLVWGGSRNAKSVRNRSIPLRVLSSELDMRAHYFCLQKDVSHEDRVHISGNPKILLFDDAINSFTATAELLNCLDLVISIDTSIAHLAGAMGKPVWLLLPFASDWRWLINRNDSPWYPSVRLYRQEQIGDWTSTFKRLRSDLAYEIGIHELS